MKNKHDTNNLKFPKKIKIIKIIRDLKKYTDEKLPKYFILC